MQFKNVIALLGVPLAIGVASIPAPASARGMVFTCVTTSGKTVRFVSNGATMSYSYGRAGARPELAFSVPRSMSSVEDGSDDVGNGSWAILHEVAVTYSGVKYTAWWHFDRSSHEVEAGLVVSRGGSVLATTPCASNIQINLDNF
jgi:hypothetical protein